MVVGGNNVRICVIFSNAYASFYIKNKSNQFLVFTRIVTQYNLSNIFLTILHNLSIKRGVS